MGPKKMRGGRESEEIAILGSARTTAAAPMLFGGKGT